MRGAPPAYVRGRVLLGDWVVTPRRRKAVEINALFYNALCLMAQWLLQEDGEARARPMREAAEQVKASFNERFWYEAGGHLYDVLDGPDGKNAPALPAVVDIVEDGALVLVANNSSPPPIRFALLRLTEALTTALFGTSARVSAAFVGGTPVSRR